MANLLIGEGQRAFQQANDYGNQLQFNRLAGQALSAPSQDQSRLLGQAAQFNPGGALAIQDGLQSNQLAQQRLQQAQQDAHMKKVNNAALFMKRALDTGNPAAINGAYQSVRPFLAQASGKEPPPTWTPELEQGLYQLLGQSGGLPQQEGAVVSQGGTLVDKATGKVMYQGQPKLPGSVEELQYLQQHPDLAQFDLQRRQASRPVTNINTAQENAFQKALGQKDADAYVGMREQATQAANTIQQADQLEQILSAQKTGKIPEALAMAGQYFGTQAGTNLQALKGVIQPLVLSQVKQLGSGSGISDADRKFIEAGMPGFGNEPEANARVLRIMRSTAQRKIDLYKQADEYVQKNGRLGGFSSPLITPEAPTPAADGWAIQRVE